MPVSKALLDFYVSMSWPATSAVQAWLRQLRGDAPPRLSAFALAISFMLAGIQRFEQPVTGGVGMCGAVLGWGWDWQGRAGPGIQSPSRSFTGGGIEGLGWTGMSWDVPCLSMLAPGSIHAHMHLCPAPGLPAKPPIPFAQMPSRRWSWVPTRMPPC